MKVWLGLPEPIFGQKEAEHYLETLQTRFDKFRVWFDGKLAPKTESWKSEALTFSVRINSLHTNTRKGRR